MPILVGGGLEPAGFSRRPTVMKSLRVAVVVLIAILWTPTRADALSCVPPKHQSAIDLVADRLIGYEFGHMPAYDLLLVGTSLRFSDLQPPESGFGHRLLTVAVAGGFGDRIDSAVIEIATTTWLDDGTPGGPLFDPIAIPLYLDDDGLYHAGMCTFGFEVADPYLLAAELATVAEAAGVAYQLFPESVLEEATSVTTTTLVTQPVVTSTSLPLATPTVPVAVAAIDDDPPGPGSGMLVSIAVFGLVVVAGSVLGWSRRTDARAGGLG